MAWNAATTSILASVVAPPTENALEDAYTQTKHTHNKPEPNKKKTHTHTRTPCHAAVGQDCALTDNTFIPTRHARRTSADTQYTQIQCAGGKFEEPIVLK